MPLIELDYSLAEAKSLISSRLPGEDPLKNLIEALHAGKLSARLVCEKTGKSHNIPAASWKSRDKSFIWRLTSQGRIDNRLIGGRRFYGSSTPTGTTTGEIRVHRKDLDVLLNLAAPADDSGRKTKMETKKKEIHDAFHKIPDSELDFNHGGLSKAVRRLAPLFPDYDPDTIRKMISPDYRERKAKQNQ